jgi:CRP-like cAMP-binding protein
MCIQGKAVVILEDKEAKTQTEIAELKEKDYFGEQALLHKGLRTATVQAKGEAVCFSLDEEAFLSIFSREKLNVRFVKRNAIAEASDNKVDSPDQKAPEKTAEQIKFLEAAVKDHVLFQSLDGDSLEFIIKQMWKQDVPNGTKIIKQGDQGNHFYVIESGEFEVYRTQHDEFAKDGVGVELLVNYLDAGKAFGELALMYNSPRAASVVACAASVVWVLDRRTFRTALRRANKDKLAEYTTFLESVPLFHSLLTSERAKIAEALEEVEYCDTDPIMVQGQEGDTFFILKKGEAIVQKEVDGVVEVVQQCSRGDFFGERALLKNEPRAATVIAKGHTVCLKIHREEFQQLLGHVHELLHEKVQSIDGRPAHSPRSPSTSTVAKPPSEETTLLGIKKDDLIVKTILGKGSFGIVMLVQDKNSGHTYALKRLNKAQMVAIGQHLHVANERNVMVQLNHPFIIKLFVLRAVLPLC